MRKRLREAENTAKRHRVWLAVGLVLLVAAGMLTAVTITNHQASAAAFGTTSTATCTSSDGKFCYGGQGNDSKSCQGAAAGTPVLWIFNPGGNSSAVPKDLVITWSDGTTVTYTGWQREGEGSFHLTVPLVGTFPPQSAFVDYSGTLGNNAVLTISGCNESSTTGTTETTATGTTSTTGTTTGTTGTTTSTTQTTTNSTTATAPATTTVHETTTVQSAPPQTTTVHETTTVQSSPPPAQTVTVVTTVQGPPSPPVTVTVKTPSGPPKVKVIVRVPKKKHGHTVPAPRVQGFTG